MESKFKIRRRPVFQTMFKLLLLCCLLLEPTHQAPVANCYPLQSDFETMCKTEFNGIVVGGQCFYAGKGSGDWDYGWTTCGTDGSALAQPATIAELNALRDVQVASGFPSTYIAVRDDIATPPCCTIMPDTTYIYKDATTLHPKLVAKDTVLKYYTGPNCQGTNTNGPPRCTGALLGGHDCTGNAPFAIGTPFCQFQNQFQNYTLTTYCMTEAPIETVAVSSVQSCPDECVQRFWCRSFNYNTANGGSICQLFTRSIDDGIIGTSKMPDVVPKNSTCAHYNHA